MAYSRYTSSASLTEILISLAGAALREPIRIESHGPRVMDMGHLEVDVNGLWPLHDGTGQFELFTKGRKHGEEMVFQFDPVTGHMKMLAEEESFWPEDSEVLERYDVRAESFDRLLIVTALLSKERTRMVVVSDVRKDDTQYGIRPWGCRFGASAEDCLTAHVLGEAHVIGTEPHPVLLHCDFQRGTSALECIHMPALVTA